MEIRIVWMQVGILLGISELFFDTYHFLILALSAFVVSFFIHYGGAESRMGLSLFCLLSGGGLLLLSFFSSLDKNSTESS